MGTSSDFKELIDKMRLASKLAPPTLELQFKERLDGLDEKCGEELKKAEDERDAANREVEESVA